MKDYLVPICASLSYLGLCPQTLFNAQTNTSLLFSYDYIIAGGGLSGLVVATRLTEDPTKTVLVIEHGSFDEADPGVLVPGLTRIGALGMKYLFNYNTVPQPGLNNRTAGVWAANVVGGGSTVNGMVFPRGAAADYDAWEALGNPGWGWDGILPYFKKSETYSPPPKAVAEEFRIGYNASAHGFSGPISSSMPGFLWPTMKNYFNAWKELGVDYTEDGNDGKAYGVYWMPNSINPKNQSRSYTRTMYYDPVRHRPNLHIITGHVVDRVLFDEDLRITGVKVVDKDNMELKVFHAEREVILAAGTVNSPGILQRSGIGNPSFLKSSELNLFMIFPVSDRMFKTIQHFTSYSNDLYPNPMQLHDPVFVAQQVALYYNTRQGLFSNNRGIALTMLPLRNMTDRYKELVEQARKEDPIIYLPPGVDPRVLEGFKSQRDILLGHFEALDATAMEITYEGRAEFDAAMQRPLSRGTIMISSTDPLSIPEIDYGVLRGPTDLKLAIEAVRVARKFMLSGPMQELGAVEISPGTDVQTDDEIEAAIRETLMLPTFGHISGSCAMQPEHLGGVVSPHLKVYGVKGLRVVDGSIMPLVSTTHLQATIYAIAEKAADLIKGDAV